MRDDETKSIVNLHRDGEAVYSSKHSTLSGMWRSREKERKIDMTKLVGYRKFASTKNGKEYCVAQVVSDVTEREANRGFVGQKVEELFLPGDQVDILKPTDIGKEIETTYELSGGRAYLVKVSVLSK